jgi:hypothetical protein
MAVNLYFRPIRKDTHGFHHVRLSECRTSACNLREDKQIFTKFEIG